MTDDRTRMSLHRRLTEQVGAEEAEYLMERLSPITWQDLATKDDIRALDTKLSSRIDALDTKIDGLDAKLSGRIDGLDVKLATLDVKLSDVRGDLYQTISQQTLRLITFTAVWSTVLVSICTLVATVMR